MNTLRNAGIMTAVLFGMASRSWGYGHDVVKTEPFEMNIGGRMQLVGYGQNVNDPVRDHNRVYLFLREARLKVEGRVEEVKYYTQFVFGAEDVNGSNNGLTGLDFAADIPIPMVNSLWLKVGQFKVPYSRESLTEEGLFQFDDHSINFLGFNLGRDIGAALHIERGNLVAAGGIFTGGARDVPLRFLPEDLGWPMTVVRVGYNDGLDKDMFTQMSQNDLHPTRTAKATYLNAMYMKDTGIGHSTVLNVRSSEKSLVTNSNWNPFIGEKIPGVVQSFRRGDYWQVGWDAAARGPLGEGMAWSAETEANYARYSNGYGRIDLAGARLQGGVIKNKVEVALRYDVLFPDQNFATSGVPVTGTRAIHEVGPAVTYYFKGHDMKLVAGLPVLIDVPVFNENGAGSYVSTEQVDQSTVIKPGTGFMRRQTVPEARLAFQFAF